MIKAIFPGSFDPFHEGHRFVVKQALQDFDFIFIVVSWNENKKRQNTFVKSKEEIEKMFSNEKDRIQVLINEKELTTDLAKKLNCFNIIRGCRNEEDKLYEEKLKYKYLLLEKRLNFFYYFANENTRNISSSNLKNKQ